MLAVYSFVLLNALLAYRYKEQYIHVSAGAWTDRCKHTHATQYADAFAGMLYPQTMLETWPQSDARLGACMQIMLATMLLICVQAISSQQLQEARNEAAALHQQVAALKAAQQQAQAEQVHV